MSYSVKKIGKQIAGYKIEMCKSKTAIKPIPLPSIRMFQGYSDHIQVVKFNFKWGPFS